jgi:tetratricopeptide (TPR) repeat protein
MPSFEGLLTVLILAGVVITALVLVSVLRGTQNSAAAQAVGRGDFEAALAAARTGRGAGRDELFAAAVAARHLLRFDEARRLLARILAADPSDGEAWLESGLASAYAGGVDDLDKAGRELGRAAALRSDLAESITLHRAWVELRKGDLKEARHLFDEVETSLENKLRTDLGGGEPLFAEWFLHASLLWEALGDSERAAWAWEEGRRSAGGSRLPETLRPVQNP